MAMGDEKYIGRIDEIDEAKRHIVVALTDVGAIKTKRIRKKVTSLLLGVWNINNGEEKEIVIYTKYDEGGKSTMALEKEETVKKISDTKVLEQCIDPEYYNY